jgi:hypothetical protein
LRRGDEVLRAFALHLHEHLLLPSGRGGSYSRAGAWTLPGCFIYVPQRGIDWEVQSLKSECGVRMANNEGRSPKSVVHVQGSKFQPPCPPAPVGYLSRFLCVGFALALLATGCASPRPLKGGRAVTTHKPAVVIEQTLVQGENPSQASKQTQESVKKRAPMPCPRGREWNNPSRPVPSQPNLLPPSRPSGNHQLSTLNPKPRSS